MTWITFIRRIMFGSALIAYCVAGWNIGTGYFITAVLWWAFATYTLYKIR